MAEEEETQPGLECINRNDEEDPDDPPLFCRVGVVPEVLVDLVTGDQDGGPGAGPGQTLPPGRLEEGRGLECVILAHDDAGQENQVSYEWSQSPVSSVQCPYVVGNCSVSLTITRPPALSLSLSVMSCSLLVRCFLQKFSLFAS